MLLPLAPLTAALLLAIAPGPQEGWPHLRGPHLDGSARSGEPAGGGPVGLRLAWKTELGPAYAGIAVAAGLALTTASRDGSDRVVALDAASGAERWSFELEPTYGGHDGSEDGTIASPVIGRGAAFVISARGRLVSLDLADGRLRWSLDLPGELGTVVPEYGFGSTPLLEDRLLIVQAGGSEGRFLCALEADSGALVWSLGDGTLEYTSPIAMDLAGRRQIVVLAGQRMMGVAPEDGALLWTHVFDDARDSVSSGMASPMDGERFFVPVSGTIVVFALASTPDGFQLEERVRVRELGRTYATPVYTPGRLWGFKSDFLTCCDAESGARLWKSRPPGGRGLIRVDDRLVVFGAQGVLALVDTNDEDYHELARIEALEQSGYTWPSCADGRVYLRSASELACVELLAGPEGALAGPAAGAAPEGAGAGDAPGLLGTFLRTLDGAEDREAEVLAFLARQERLPLQEPGWVHFLFQGQAEDVALAGSMVDGSRPDPLLRVPGTTLFHRSYPIEPGARWEYRFQVDYGEWIADPRNPDTVPGAWGPPMSVVATPEHVERGHYRQRAEDVPGRAHGRLESLSFTAQSPPSTRTVLVYLPAGYDEGLEDLPLLIVQQGSEWVEKGSLVNTLDSGIPTRFRPLIAVFVPPIEEWWYEGGGTGTEEYLAMLAREFLPFLATRYRLSGDPREHALLGKESFGMTALLGPLLQPEAFGRAAAVSLSLGDRARHTLFTQLENDQPPGLFFFVGWNRYEERNRDRGSDSRRESRRVADALRVRGHALAGGEVLDAAGWGSWREHADDFLSALFPPE